MSLAKRDYDYNEYRKKYIIRRHNYNFELGDENSLEHVKKENKGIIAQKDKKRILQMIFFMGLLCIAVIISTSYCATVQYRTNEILETNHVIKGEIENLKVDIKKGVNIGMLEEKAINELGMIHPTAANYVYLKAEDNAVKNFALIMKEQAYL